MRKRQREGRVEDKKTKKQKNLEHRLIPLSSTLINCTLFILPLFLCSLCLGNNGLFVMQETSSTSIIPPVSHPPPPTTTTFTATLRRCFHHHHHHHHLVLRRNKYGNEEPVIGNFKLGSLVLKKDTNVLIAAGWRNPIFCGH